MTSANHFSSSNPKTNTEKLVWWPLIWAWEICSNRRKIGKRSRKLIACFTQSKIQSKAKSTVVDYPWAAKAYRKIQQWIPRWPTTHAPPQSPAARASILQALSAQASSSSTTKPKDSSTTIVATPQQIKWWRVDFHNKRGLIFWQIRRRQWAGIRASLRKLINCLQKFNGSKATAC